MSYRGKKFRFLFGIHPSSALHRAVLTALLAWVWVLAAAAASAQRLPVFDAHIHYNRPQWESLAPNAVLDILRKGGVTRAFVSSTPDEGTLSLHRMAPQLIVPVLRPYRDWSDRTSWFRNADILAYLKDRLRTNGNVYRGIGEFHMGWEDADSDIFRHIVELAAKRSLFLHAHVDDVTIAKLAGMRQDVCVLWAHAGMSAEPEVISRLLDRFSNLWTELSLRWDVSHDGLKPEWRRLFLRHPARFLIGTDTWNLNQWEFLPATLDGYRQWLRELPASVAKKIAYQNAETLARRGACAPPQAASPRLQGSG